MNKIPWWSCRVLGVAALVLAGLSGSAVPVVQAQTAPPSGEIAYIDGGNLWLLDLGMGRSRQLTTEGANASPAWSPDGQRLAYVGDQFVTAGDIYTLDPQNARPTRVTRTPDQQKTYVTYAPDGALLYVRLIPATGKDYRNEIVRRTASGQETVLYRTAP